MLILRLALLLSVATLAGCASSSGTADGTADGATEENAVIHTATEADLAAIKSDAPLTADAAVLYVNGLGCPLCATNVDRQLIRLRGVKTAVVDLSTGTVTIGMTGERRPSPKAIAYAVEDAGFTLVRIDTP
jgi:copper chaperone CopZ